MSEMFNQSLSHGLQILLLYDRDLPAFSVAEIAKRLGFGASKTYRLVRPLIQFGFLQEIPGTGLYSLGMSAVRTGLLAQQTFNLAGIALPFMSELSRLTKETVTLTGLHDTKVIVLEELESKETIRVSLFRPGSVIPFHAGASSKALVAHLPDNEWDRIIEKEGLKPLTPRTIIDPNRLKEHFREIRKKGYALSDREVDPSVRGAGAVIFNDLGQPVGGLSVAGPVYRISKQGMSQLRRRVVEYARKISSRLGYGGIENREMPLRSWVMGKGLNGGRRVIHKKSRR